MSITDELREWFKDRIFMANGWQEIRDIADRIDVEHERELRETGEDIVRDVKREWVRLPVDADGVPFHIGDKVDSDHYEDGTVIGIQYFKAPNGVVFEEIAVQPNGWDTATWRDPEEYAHHHEPTVEDVLREMLCAWEDTLTSEGVDGIIAEFAAKLRLAKEGE